MGNLFESETDHSTSNGDRASSRDEHSLFSPAELKQVELARQKLMTIGSCHSHETIDPFPSRLLLDAIISHSIASSSEKFVEFIGTCTRSNKSTTLRCVWDLLTCTTSNTGSNPQSQSQSQLHRLLYVTMEICGINEIQSSSLVARLYRSIHKQSADEIKSERISHGSTDGAFTQQNHPTLSQDKEFQYLQSWVRQYAPHLPNVFETLFNALCFGPSYGSPLTKFSPPMLSIPSEVVSSCDLLPLAFHHSLLQGSWRRLYSSSNDGLSFNRIAHHVIGYEVRNLLI